MATTHDFTPDELAHMLGEARTVEDDGIAALIGSASVPRPSDPVVGLLAPTVGENNIPVVQGDDHAWTAAYPLVPNFQRLLSRYPAIGLSQHPKHGLVLLAAYLEDTTRRVRRNLKLGEHLFFAAPELELVEPDTKALNCRVIIKTLPHQVGMRIRYWENTPNGDVPGKSGTFIVTERGLERLGLHKGRP